MPLHMPGMGMVSAPKQAACVHDRGAVQRVRRAARDHQAVAVPGSELRGRDCGVMAQADQGVARSPAAGPWVPFCGANTDKVRSRLEFTSHMIVFYVGHPA